MNDRDAMQLLLCALLLLSCLTRLIRRTLFALQGDRALPVVMLSAGFLLFSGALCGIIERFAGAAMLLPALLLLTIFGTCAALLQSLVSLRTLRQLLPAGFDTGDLIVVLLLLLMAGDKPEDKNTALLTLALYCFL